jgi:hypothetical protein
LRDRSIEQASNVSDGGCMSVIYLIQEQTKSMNPTLRFINVSSWIHHVSVLDPTAADDVRAPKAQKAMHLDGEVRQRAELRQLQR